MRIWKLCRGDSGGDGQTERRNATVIPWFRACDGHAVRCTIVLGTMLDRRVFAFTGVVAWLCACSAAVRSCGELPEAEQLCQRAEGGEERVACVCDLGSERSGVNQSFVINSIYHKLVVFVCLSALCLVQYTVLSRLRL